MDLDVSIDVLEVTFRWRDGTRRTLELHLPVATIRAVLDDLSDCDAGQVVVPNGPSSEDSPGRNVMLALSDVIGEDGADFCAETTAQLLTARLRVRDTKIGPRPTPTPEDRRFKRIDKFMRENLGSAISLNAIAKEAGLSRFHLVRLFKQVHGETPFKRLTRLRMEEAQRRLRQGRESVTEIAFACGYENSAHFATAFRRSVGVPPSLYRQRDQAPL